MIIRYVLLFILFICLNSCIFHKQSSRECLYSKIPLDQVSFEDQVSSLQKSALSLINDINDDHTQLIYYSRDPSLRIESSYLILALFDSEKFHLVNLDGKGRLKKELTLLSSDKKIKKLRILSNDLPSKSYERDCMVEDGIESLFYSMKSKKITYFFRSSGYDCNVPDSDNLMSDSYPIISEIFKLGYVP